MGRQPKAVDQLGFDEQVIDDPAIEAALEERARRKDELGAVNKIYKAADEVAKAKITELELPDGGAARVGRFRITRTAISAKSVSFETKESSRIRISLVDDGAAVDDAQDDAPEPRQEPITNFRTDPSDQPPAVH